MFIIKSLLELENEGIIELGRGKIISRKDLATKVGKYPVYSSSKVGNGKFGEYGEFMFDEELITWSVDGGGKLFHREKHKFSVTNVTGFLRTLKPNVLHYKYLFYVLTFLHSKISFDWVKKAHPSVLRKEYTQIPVPPLPEQKRIVAKLDKAFAEIDKLIELSNEKYNSLKKFEHSLFNKLFNDDLEGWTTSKLGDVIEKTSTVSPNKHFPNKHFDYIDVSSVNNETLEIEETQSLLGKDAPSRARRIVELNDVIFATVRPTLKRIAIIPSELDKQICSTGYIVLRAKKNVISSKYIFYWMCSPKTFKYMIDNQAGASYPAVSDKQVKELNISFPDLNEQQKATDKMDKAIDYIMKIFIKGSLLNKNYKSLKSAILKKELQGEAA